MEIRVMQTAAFKAAYEALVPGFEKASGHKVTTLWTPSVDMMKKLKDGEVVDMAIMSATAIDELIKHGRLVARTNLATSGIGAATAVCFAERGIPYRILGGVSFWARAEVRDLVAYLRLLANPRDGAAVKRALAAPSRGMGAKAIEWITKSSLPNSAAARCMTARMSSSFWASIGTR